MTRNPDDWKDDFGLEVQAAAKGMHPMERGIDPELDVIIHRMERGDLMPLAHALADLDDQLASVVGYELKWLLANGYLRVKIARRAHRNAPICSRANFEWRWPTTRSARRASAQRKPFAPSRLSLALASKPCAKLSLKFAAGLETPNHLRLR